MPLNGQKLERYHLLRLVGSGGMGKVYLAEDTHIPRQVAVKIVQTEPTLHSDEQEISDALRLFHREMEVIAKLDHSHILPLYDFGEVQIGTNLITYMAMPYRPEGSLEDWLQRLEASPGLSFQNIAHIISQASDALQHAHEHNIVHQDVKPSNFLVRTKTGNLNHPDIFLVDFGVAKLMTATMTTSQSVRGTPGYMAPEQWNGQAIPATDQYALAIMAYYLLTGRTPFTGNLIAVMHQHLDILPPSPGTYNTNIPPALDAVILRALAKRPEDRYAHITDFATAFEQALHYQTVLNPFTLNGYAPQHTYEAVQQPVAPTLNVSQPQQIFLSEPTKPDFNERNGVVAHTLQSTDTFLPPPDNHAQGNNVLNPYPPTPPSHRSRSLLATVVLGILAALIILSGVGIFGLVTYQNHVNQSNTNSTATANTTAQEGKATDTAQVNATNTVTVAKTESANTTATAVVQASQAVSATRVALTATAVAQSAEATTTAQSAEATTTAQSVGATATVFAEYPYPSYMLGQGQGTLALYDPLSQENNWSNGSGNTGSCQFSNNAYYIRVQQADSFFYCQNTETFSNFAFEVQMTIIQGNCGGMLFRADSTSGHSYYFQVCQDGSYRLIRYMDNTGKNTVDIIPSKNLTCSSNSTEQVTASSSPYMNCSTGQANTIAILANGGSIILYVNGQQIDNVQDDSYASGNLALFANEISDTTQVEFSNAKVWTLQ